MEPTIFTNVGQEMRIAQEEIFGPVLTVFKASGLEEAIQISNNVKFGLTRIKPGETIQQNLFQQQWSAVQTFFSNFEPPVYVFPPDARNGIGQSAMTAGSN